MARRKRSLLGSHQKCWLWGRHVVLETLRAGKWPPIELHLSHSLPDEDRRTACDLANAAAVPVGFATADALRKLCRSDEHQGYVAKMPDFPYDDPEQIIETLPASPLLVLLDGVQDPYNFGAIVRSAVAFGVDALLLKESGQVGVTSLAARASAGAVNFVPIARTMDLGAFAERLRDRGVCLIGTEPNADRAICEIGFRGPSAILIGNEAAGLSAKSRRICEVTARIPLAGHVDSLNAAVAAGIVLYEAARQRSDSVKQP